MRYDAETKIISIDVRELVTDARRRVCTTLPKDSDEPSLATESASGERIFYEFTVGENLFSLELSVGNIYENTVALRHPVSTSPKRIRNETLAQARGEGYVTAFVLSEIYGYDEVNILITFENRDTGETEMHEERVKRDKLLKFFEKCREAIILFATPEIERVTKRLPSMKNVRFPYADVRPGQDELMHAVYRNISRGTRLFAAAPTGTGKTVSVLYPAIRALGCGKCEKVFYFTPKATTARAAEECINTLCEGGATIRSLTLSSKEKICERGVVCRESRESCENSKNNRLAEAVIALYNMGRATVDYELVRECSREYGVCPYELSLSYAELCDVVICDLNYLFDPSVMIRRFFTVTRDFAFLIDEAHNLGERAREIYSATLSEEDIVSVALDPIAEPLSELKNAARGTANHFCELLMPYVKEELYTDRDGERVGAVHLSDVPYELYGIFEKLLVECEEAIFKSLALRDQSSEARVRTVRDYYYKIKKFYDTLTVFDNHYELFIFLEKGAMRAKAFCIDPSREISKRLERGRSAVLFSGTLSPMYYYRSLLGGDGSSESLEVDSPFDPSQLSVTVMDKISTRLSERDDTLGAVCRVIAATVGAKKGNYMIFSPSFTYSEALAKYFSAKYPKIRTLVQRRDMTARERGEFLDAFREESSSYLIGFSVMGGIYSEGIDLAGDSLIGAIIVGIGIPQLSYEREAIAAYYQDKYEEGKQFAYVYPGANRVLQAAGRVIRREDDRGVVVMIDDRFDDPIYKSVVPNLFSGMKFLGDPKQLRARLDEFWQNENK